MSSLTMVLALSAIQRGDHRRLRIWLLATALLGASFIAGQVYEFTAFIREGLTHQDQPVRQQLLRAHRLPRRARDPRHRDAAVARRACRCGASCRSEKSEVVEIAGLYWHFVDIVWIVIFTVVYLIPAPGSEAREQPPTTRRTRPSPPTDVGQPDERHAHPTDAFYIKVALVLAAHHRHRGRALLPGARRAATTTRCSFLSAIKFVAVVAFFMHLKFDNRILRRLFVAGFVLAILVYVAYMLTLGVFVG